MFAGQRGIAEIKRLHMYERGCTVQAFALKEIIQMHVCKMCISDSMGCTGQLASFGSYREASI